MAITAREWDFLMFEPISTRARYEGSGEGGLGRSGSPRCRGRRKTKTISTIKYCCISRCRTLDRRVAHVYAVYALERTVERTMAAVKYAQRVFFTMFVHSHLPAGQISQVEWGIGYQQNEKRRERHLFLDPYTPRKA